MKYKINWERSNEVFVLPKNIVNKYIHIVSYEHIKVLMFLFLNKDEDVDYTLISNFANITSECAKDIVAYWQVEGLIYLKDFNVDNKVQKKTLKETLSLTKDEYTDYILGDDYIKFMLDKSEQILGRTIKHSECNILVSSHKLYGLPIDVVLMIVAYCHNLKKDNFSYIQKTIINWSENEIDTLEKAEHHIMFLESKTKSDNIIKELFGINNRVLTKKQSEFANIWVNELNINTELILEAYDRCVENIDKISFSYINKILLSWHENGYKTLNDLSVLSDKADDKSYNIDTIQNYIDTITI